MRITGSVTVPHTVGRVWDALLDPAVLVQTIPGCSRLETTGDNSYAMTVTAGVAAIKGTYDGTCELSDLAVHESLVMRLQGAGAPGTIDATVDVRFAEGPTGTTIAYDADAVVGGMVGGVGQRMLASVSKRMAGEFFDNVGHVLADERPVEGAPDSVTGSGDATPTVDSRGAVFTAPPRPAGGGDDFLKGIAVGAGLVLLGVGAGSVFGRRR